MQYKDYYKILGLDKNASQEEIKKLTGSLQKNITLMSTQKTSNQRRCSRISMRHMKS